MLTSEPEKLLVLSEIRLAFPSPVVYTSYRGDMMTHVEKIAEYRTALEAREEHATEEMVGVCSRGGVWYEWYGFRKGIRKAQALLKMLD